MICDFRSFVPFDYLYGLKRVFELRRMCGLVQLSLVLSHSNASKRGCQFL